MVGCRERSYNTEYPVSFVISFSDSRAHADPQFVKALASWTVLYIAVVRLLEIGHALHQALGSRVSGIVMTAMDTGRLFHLHHGCCEKQWSMGDTLRMGVPCSPAQQIMLARES